MKERQNNIEIKVIDLFCGIGGLTRGFINRGLQVLVGIDNDLKCKYGYEASNGARFLCMDIKDVNSEMINQIFGEDKKGIRVLVGCAPCQPYSGLNLKKISSQDKAPLKRFVQLIKKTLPDIVSMENVSRLKDKNKYPIFKTFLTTLQKNKYEYSYEIVNAADYGVPQNRKRLVLLASRLGPIKLIAKTHSDKKITVRETIGHLNSIKDGEIDNTDSLHRTRKLSPLNKKRIMATKKNGGNSKDWNDNLILKCHKKKSGRTYKSTVYGRMSWDKPAPTMTTQCIGLGNGRFGHPSQNRAISIREAALFQSFRTNYIFCDPDKKMVVSDVVRFIGNAVPIRLSEIIAESIKQHVQYICKLKQ